MVNYKARLNPTAFGAKTKLTSGQTITTATWTIITWASTLYDNIDFWSSGTPTRLTAPYKGIFLIGYGADWGATSGGKRQHEIKKNGSFFFGAYRADSSGSSVEAQTTLGILEKDDYIELQVHHTLGSDLDIDATEATNMIMTLVRRL